MRKKPWGHSGAFEGIWGQISDIAKSGQIIPQNEALEISFSKKAFLRSKKIDKGQKSQKKPKKSNFGIYETYTNNTSK